MGRGRVRAGEQVRAAKTPGSEPRGPGPASSARFPYPKAGGVPAPERAAGTITAPVRGTAPGHGHGNGPGGGSRGGPGGGGGGGHGPGPGGGQGGGHGPGPDDAHGPDDNQSHSHGHSHSHGPAAPVSMHLRKIIGPILIPFAVAVVVGLAVLWPGGAPAHERTGVGFDRQTQEATVTKVVAVDCKSVNASGETPTGDTSTAEGSSAQQQATGDCKRATIRVDTGDDKGRTFTEIVQPDAVTAVARRARRSWSPTSPRRTEGPAVLGHRREPQVPHGPAGRHLRARRRGRRTACAV